MNKLYVRIASEYHVLFLHGTPFPEFIHTLFILPLCCTWMSWASNSYDSLSHWMHRDRLARCAGIISRTRQTHTSGGKCESLSLRFTVTFPPTSIRFSSFHSKPAIIFNLFYFILKCSETLWHWHREWDVQCSCRGGKCSREKVRWLFFFFFFFKRLEKIRVGTRGFYYVRVQGLRWLLKEIQRNWTSGGLSASSCGAPRPKPGIYCGGASGSGGWQVGNPLQGREPLERPQGSLTLLSATFSLIKITRDKNK